MQQRLQTFFASRQRPVCLQGERTVYCLHLPHFLSACYSHPSIQNLNRFRIQWSGGLGQNDWYPHLPSSAPGNILQTQRAHPPPRKLKSVVAVKSRNLSFPESSWGVLIISHIEEPQRISASQICKCLRDQLVQVSEEKQAQDHIEARQGFAKTREEWFNYVQSTPTKKDRRDFPGDPVVKISMLAVHRAHG